MSPPLSPLASGGDASAARMPSAPVPVSRFTRLPPGLPRFEPVKVDDCAGSMSSEERNEVLSRSVFVLVIERKESIRSFCCCFGVPLRSKIYATC